MRIDVIQEDATQVDAYVLALKYAQARYGLDDTISQRLKAAGRFDDDMSPQPGDYRLLRAPEDIAAKWILFVGVEPLWKFGYREIRIFARKILSSLEGELPDTRRVLVTVHGPGYGLDEEEAFESQVAGFLDAIESLDIPRKLERITIVERDPDRARRLERTLFQLLPGGFLADLDGAPLSEATPEARERLRSVGYASASKAHVFVAMPFADEFEDVYHYGIRSAVKSAGLLCERSDLSSFTGDVMGWVKDRIRNASLVIADLSQANPNVYLEVGFAWGCGVPTLLLAQCTDELDFNVRGQKCLLYERIRDLEEKLGKELQDLKAVPSLKQ